MFEYPTLRDLNSVLQELWSNGLITVTYSPSGLPSDEIRRQKIYTIFSGENYFASVLNAHHWGCYKGLSEVSEHLNGRGKMSQILQEIKPIFYTPGNTIERVLTLHMHERIAIHHGKYTSGIPDDHPLKPLRDSLEKCSFRLI